jgi:hypothetical protein
MFDAGVRFPVWTGDVLAEVRAGLGSGVVVQRKRPETMPAKLVTLRSDGGSAGQTLATVQGGVNVWAAAADGQAAATVAENLALDVVDEIRGLPAAGVFKSVSVSLPFEVEDDPAFTYQGGELAHFYFAFSGVLKGV